MGTNDLDIGTRLRQLRESRGFSQRELARRAGITNGTISLIEQNRTQTTVASLRKVLGGFPMTLAEFFSLAPPPKDKIFFEPGELAQIAGSLHSKNGHVVLLQVGSALGRKLQVLVERYPKGADTGKLKHDGEEGGVVVAGRVEVTVGKQTRVLGKGSAYLFNSNIPHRARNVGDGECLIISACTPPYL